MTDPITDMFNRIKNAQAIQKEIIEMPLSKAKFKIAKILKEKGFILDFKKSKKAKKDSLKIKLKYQKGKPAIVGFKRVSKPGRKIYKPLGEIKEVKGGYGISIISTSKGILSNGEAKKKKVGGEVMVEVW